MPKTVEHSRKTMDARLAGERARTDDEFEKRDTTAEQKADEVLRMARLEAAEVLRAARERADAILQESGPSQSERDEITDVRTYADHDLPDAYARADEIIAEERAERARTLVALLEHERLETNEGLLLERIAADELLRRREDFLGIVSHDLRNELGSIAMSVAQIVQRAPHDDVGHRIFRSATNVQRITLRMSRLIGDLLDVVSIEAGKLLVVPDDDDVGRVVGGAIESFQPVAAAKGIALTTETTGESTPLKFDHQRIHQVVATS
jgi:signal transduction histidine kinase